MSECPPDFDVIVIGAGVAGGLPVGAYLQKAGARVLLVDGNNSAGIHCQSYEYQSGARCVPCAGGFAGGMMPLWDDLELEEHGAEMIVNRRIFGCVYPDDTSLFIGPDAEGTIKDIAKFTSVRSTTRVPQGVRAFGLRFVCVEWAAMAFA